MEWNTGECKQCFGKFMCFSDEQIVDVIVQATNMYTEPHTKCCFEAQI